MPLQSPSPGNGHPKGTWIHLLDWTGAERWVAQVPFIVRQPGIDGGGGRVVVSGDALAAVENGAVAWQQRFEGPVKTTAFDGGELAVASGNALRVLNRDGTLAQELHLQEESPITTPPAIAEDGAVWVATKNALYVARPAQ